MTKFKLPFLIVLTSLLFTFFTYLSSILNKNIIDTFTGIFLLAFPQAKEGFLKTDFFYYVPNFFTVFVWALIGILCYLFYYSVALLYYYIHDFVLAKFFFVHTGPGLPVDLTKKKEISNTWCRHFCLSSASHVFPFLRFSNLDSNLQKIKFLRF